MAGKKLLVADDSLTIQKVIRLALSNEGYEIQAVSDGNDAIQQISLFRPDVVLIDVSLPGKSAFEVKRAINEHNDLDEVRFVLMSSAFEKVDEAQADEVKFHGRLTKPFDPAHLRQVLTEVLAQVTAKRMEPTSILQRPAAPAPAPVPEPVAFVPPPLPEQQPVPQSSDTPIFQAPPPPSAAERIGLSLPEQTNPSLSRPQGHVDLPDDWMSPISAPQDPILQDQHSEPVGNLWEKDEEPTARISVAPPSPQAIQPTQPPSPAPAFGEPEDSDIKHLTESTIRMSGLDDFQWSVQEPSLKPPPSMLEATGTTFYVEQPGEGFDGMPPFQPERAESPQAPVSAPPLMQAPAESPVPASEARELESALSSVGSPVYSDGEAKPPSAFYRDANTEVTARIPRPPQATPSPVPPPLPQSPPRTQFVPQESGEASVIPISADQMEALIKKQLEETFERMAGKLLPELAERIIKQEIHRMLSEQP